MAKSEQKFMEKFSDRELIHGFLKSWSDGDPDEIKSSIFAILKRFGGTNISRETGIPRSTLYDMVKDEHSPTLDNLCLILEFAKLKLKKAA